MWKYDLNSNEWTWLSGSNTPSQPGMYGEKGIADVNNHPGSRYGGCLWIGENDAIYIFGGYGLASNTSDGKGFTDYL